jgi:uncharacterized damage-inducible protein DinB
MPIKDALLPEFDHEMASTRKTLERVPEDKFGWKPHEKSMTMGRLAGHVAELPGWTVQTLKQDSLDIAPISGPPFQPKIATSRADLLAFFDKSVADGRAALASTSDEEMMKPWSLLAGGKTMMTMPKVAVLRTFVLSHGIHHRAQLGVYLRLNDVAVPSVYGPSADEGSLTAGA